MKKIFISILCLFAVIGSNAQKFYTKNGLISFYSKAKLEDIKADNNEVLSVINPATGEIQFSLLNTGFHFPKATMEEHFNEDYMESEKYPKSTFKGKITNLSDINFTKDGTYNTTVTGDLFIHGVTNKVTATGTITVKNGVISSNSKFKINLSDYKINISIVKNNVAETIEITVACTYPNKI
ncbi:YceI family protein [Ferruginibacter albus]|uniref:YceI family protein n=1 Tax=Ferruginibacter albus TaxID=2875540 RepID=UPI001CC58987|nr:YceI family protein [Ferruginibacter albus]UAY52272.1 YceI family protein [Ferruginibacter albus]